MRVTRNCLPSGDHCRCCLKSPSLVRRTIISFPFAFANRTWILARLAEDSQKQQPNRHENGDCQRPPTGDGGIVLIRVRAKELAHGEPPSKKTGAGFKTVLR